MMKVPMGPPPPRNPTPTATPDPNSEPPPQPPSVELHVEEPTAVPPPPSVEAHAEEPTAVPPPPSVEPHVEEPTSVPPHPSVEPHAEPKPDTKTGSSLASSGSQTARAQVPYTIPEWSEPPDQLFSLEVLKEGSIIEQLDVSEKGAYMFGRTDLCDFILEHPTISRFHAVLQFKGGSGVFIYDLDSTHGTFVNKNQIKKKVFTDIHVGDVLRFGMSSRLYIFQGPSEMMPPEADLEKIRKKYAARQEMKDRRESLLRAKKEASLAEGISWGISEDAIEDSTEEDIDEITWQNYKGQLTERQEKTKSKVLKRLEKITHMKKEIDAIRAKDISQGGLTQGQQTQIARNEQRTAQLLEELDNLEETLNESIRESLGARSGIGTKNNKKKVGTEDEDDDVISDEDDFYDRTKKKKNKLVLTEKQSVETADSLLDKKDLLTTEMENKKKLLENEKIKLENKIDGGDGDDLDAFMTGLSSQLVQDKVAQIEKEIEDLGEELEKTVYLLKIADPLGEAIKKREDLKSKPILSQNNPFKEPKSIFKEPKIVNNNDSSKDAKLSINLNPLKEPPKPNTENNNNNNNNNKNENKLKENEKIEKKVFSVPKPQWLGERKITDLEENDVAATEGATSAENEKEEEKDDFVDYKDRKIALNNNTTDQSDSRSEIEEAKPGLIIRKRKEPVNDADSDRNSTDFKAPRIESESSAADAVALLLKHERGYKGLDEELLENEGKIGKKEKRVLGPSKPDFLDTSKENETWVPPEGQTGDGRTKLNERFGY